MSFGHKENEARHKNMYTYKNRLDHRISEFLSNKNQKHGVKQRKARHVLLRHELKEILIPRIVDETSHTRRWGTAQNRRHLEGSARSMCVFFPDDVLL